MNQNDRYARQRLIEWWDQNKLSQARVLIAGAGALGNELLKNLALLGVGHLLIIDFDHIEPSNLSRAPLFTPADIDQKKAATAAAALSRLNPDLTIQTIHGDLFYDVGLGHYRHSDLIIGCLDSLAARAQVGLSAALAGVPYLDGGMWSLGGEVRWFMAGDGPCFDCTMNADDRARADERRSCTGFRDPLWDETERVPTVATTAAIIGGLLGQEAAKYLCRYPVAPGKAIVYNGQSLTMHRAELVRNPDCPSIHTPYSDVQELPHKAAVLTPTQLFEMARAHLSHDSLPDDKLLLELGRDFLYAFHCDNCHRSQTINKLWGKALETERICPHCGAVRQPKIVRTVAEGDPYSRRSLADLGVPPGEVLVVRAAETLLFYELAADIDLS